MRALTKPRIASNVVIRGLLPLILLATLFGAQIAQRFAPQLLPGLTVTTHTLFVDDEKVWVHVYTGPADGLSTGLTFVSLHDDENSSAQVAREYIAQNGGRLIELRHGRGRNVAIRHDGHKHWFDPNRMFTNVGLIRTLSYFQAASDRNIATATKFAREVEAIIAIEAGGTIIAMHNNTDENLSINDYQKGEMYGENTREILMADGEDTDNYFYTNDSILFRSLADAGYNSALTEETPLKDSGSLAILTQQKKARYVLVEAEHGQIDHQREMIESLVKVLGINSSDSKGTK